MTITAAPRATKRPRARTVTRRKGALHDDTLTFTDVFCGAGGSSIGLREAGFTLKLAANHWDRAIATHAENFPDAEHLQADVSNYDWRRAPRTHVGWFSPECTWHSPAGGRKRIRSQLDLFDDYVPDDGGVRSRATAFDVIRATEVHQYPVVIVENVVEFADWPMFDWWLDGMVKLGYQVSVICVSSAHVGGEGNPYAPQWRDRLYLFFVRDGLPMPDTRPRPTSWCQACGEVVAAVQAWKDPKKRRIGKYGAQYVYKCPNARCRHAIVEPYVLPAAAAIDWSDVGTRIGDRARPLAPATIRRIEAGLRMFAQPAVVAHHGNTWERPGSDYTRAWPALEAPLFARTSTPGDGLAASPAMIVPNRTNNVPSPVQDPTPPLTTGTNLGLTVAPGAFIGKAYTPRGRAEQMVKDPTGEPLGSITTSDHHELVTPPFMVERRDYDGPDASRLRGVDEPMATITATGRAVHTLVQSPFTVELRNHADVAPITDPVTTVTGGGNIHGVATPGSFLTKHHGGLSYGPIEHMNKDVTDPFPTIVAAPNVSLVIPYRRGKAKTTGEPLHTLATRESAAVVAPAVDVEDCFFRMLQPREHLRAQRFPDSYRVLGNKSEQTMQAGNAVSSNVAHWLATMAHEVLVGAAA